MVPKLELKLFPVVSSSFWPILLVPGYSPALINPLFPGVPELSVVIYVVKNASRLKSVALQPNQDGKRFAFQLGSIVTLAERLCKGFFASRAPQMLGGNKQIGAHTVAPKHF